MKKIIFIFSSIAFLSFSGVVCAAKDPIAWSLSPAGGLPANVTSGSTYAVTYTMTNNLPFAVPLTVSAAYVGGTFTITNGCNTTLAAKNQAGSSCQVYIAFQPITARTHQLQLTLAYHHNRVPLPWLSSSASSITTNENISGHVTEPLPSVTYTGTSYPIAFTFVNNGTENVTATSVNLVDFSALTNVTNTCAAALSPGSTCAVTGTFSPATTGQTSFGVTYVYSNGQSVSVPLSTQTNVQTAGTPCHHVNGTVSLPLPFSTYQYADHVIQYTFTNHCDASTEKLGTVTFAADSSATLTKGTDTCSGATLAANASCSVFLSAIPTATSADLSVTASVPYNGSAMNALATTSTVVNALTNQGASHTLLFVNQCNQNVWYEFQNGAGGTKSPDPTPAGQRTFPDYQLNQQLTGAAPSTKVLNVTEYVNGAIYGRTGCNALTGICATANCPVIAGTATCQAGVGAENPTTIFETNMANATASDGVYDVSIINGFNIPGEVRSLAPVGADTSQSQLFGCGQSAGAVIQPAASSALGACSWSFTPPSTQSPDNTANFYWVAGGSQDGCTSATNCGTGNYCGMAYNSSTAGETPINRRCGAFLGYWTIADYIGYSSASQWGTNVNLYTEYALGTALGTGPTGVSYGNVVTASLTYPADRAAMFGCIPTDNNSLNSGYTYTTNVCGCYNWNKAGSLVPTAQSSNCTVPDGQNSDWINLVFNRILWLKRACPTAYSYQFDDKSVSFQCNVAAQKTAYQVVYCPAGKTGAPGT